MRKWLEQRIHNQELVSSPRFHIYELTCWPWSRLKIRSVKTSRRLAVQKLPNISKSNPI